MLTPMITMKQYQCPTCRSKTVEATNHLGEIYSGCKTCFAPILYCAEPEAVTAQQARKAITRTFHYYRYDLRQPADQWSYLRMTSELNDRGLDPWHLAPITQGGRTHKMMQALKEWDGTTVTIYDPAQWEDQFVASIGRLHTWMEVCWPNKMIREGYYLSNA